MSEVVYQSDLIRFTYDSVQCWCGNTLRKKGFNKLEHTDPSIRVLTELYLSDVILYGCRECGRIFVYSDRTIEKYIKCIGMLHRHRLNAREIENILSK